MGRLPFCESGENTASPRLRPTLRIHPPHTTPEETEISFVEDDSRDCIGEHVRLRGKKVPAASLRRLWSASRVRAGCESMVIIIEIHAPQQVRLLSLSYVPVAASSLRRLNCAGKVGHREKQEYESRAKRNGTRSSDPSFKQAGCFLRLRNSLDFGKGVRMVTVFGLGGRGLPTNDQLTQKRRAASHLPLLEYNSNSNRSNYSVHDEPHAHYDLANSPSSTSTVFVRYVSNLYGFYRSGVEEAEAGDRVFAGTY
ncbi:hypothetical protein R3P38DRAFT_3363072 [Favolaschia claudopus]|uniref:Uncharacterized protein n=1 Tax=Favolaschia claudopus TaxID=2862362 RepID=A0AAW0AJA5_9AGAR